MKTSSELTSDIAELPDGHLVRVLLDQHERIRELLRAIPAATGLRRELFDQLRLLLAVHESAEEALLRPISRSTAGDAVAGARTAEETEARGILAELEGIEDVSGRDFGRGFDALSRVVLAHAEQEELEEFPTVWLHGEAHELRVKGHLVLAAENWAPVHPHLRADGSDSLKTFGRFEDLLEKSRGNFRRLL